MDRNYGVSVSRRLEATLSFLRLTVDCSEVMNADVFEHDHCFIFVCMLSGYCSMLLCAGLGCRFRSPVNSSVLFAVVPSSMHTYAVDTETRVKHKAEQAPRLCLTRLEDVMIAFHESKPWLSWLGLPL